MRKMILAVCFLGSLYALASPQKYNVEFDLFYQGSQMEPQNLILEPGKAKEYIGQLGDKNVFIAVTATPEGQKSVALAFDIGNITEEGQRQTVSRPRIVAMLGEKSEIEVGQADAKEPELKIIVLAK
jgi:hypothetical protein